MSEDMVETSSLHDSNVSEESNWDDVEPDVEDVDFVSLFDTQRFSTLPKMLDHCKQHHNFDLLANIRRLDLDFLGAVKLVNFIRYRAQDDLGLPNQVCLGDIEDDRYLKPALENDAVIFSLDEILETSHEQSASATDGIDDSTRELLSRNKTLETELEAIRESFANYRLAVEQTLDRRWGVDDVPAPTLESKEKDPSSYYFESYAHNEIHETMLKDFVRTDAYRDFIYENKHIFKNKVVLDIGCGTGILSMFCAKAGASQVIAVDKSDIIDKARENVFNNNLSDKITCIRGSIEDVSLPVKEVDIIVSEWMGYCLLYEAMLPSVLYARDKYLKPDGLLVPSSASIWIAPLKDETYVSDHISYWRDVYGFDMKAMQEGIYDEVRVQAMPKSSICGEPYPFKVLDLYSICAQDLTFTADWSAAIGEGVDGFDGFLVWFDNFFSPSRAAPVPDPSATPAAWVSDAPGNVAFTTGPDGPETHWKQGLLLIEQLDSPPSVPSSGRLAGQVSFSPPSDNARALSMRVTWSGGNGDNQQTWELK